MCYNVLCDKYCTRQMYGYCPSWALNWEYRKKGIIDEIRHGAADIISLQVRAPIYSSEMCLVLDQLCVKGILIRVWVKSGFV